ncbi:MAG: 16S rRNA processing protein RimM [Candidatus Latescibacteria bacterium]|jgi:16S rRNA processing protein RimM|nr:16S rRNA processing protein RimM [Candidatus Latescibacterota bacterium]
MQTEHSDKLVAVGRVIKARGLEGKLKVKPLTDFIQRFEKLDSVKVELPNREIKSFEVEKASLKNNIVLVKLKGIDDRDAADAFRGLYFYVKKNELFPLDEDSFYIFDLEGMEIIDSSGTVGHVKLIERYPANDVLVIETDAEHIMIPAVKEYIKEVNVEKRQITVDLPEGLPSYPKGSK